MEKKGKRTITGIVSVLCVFKTVFQVKIWETGASNLPYYVQLVCGDERIDLGYVQNKDILPKTIQKLEIIYTDESGRMDNLTLCSHTDRFFRSTFFSLEKDVQFDKAKKMFCVRRLDTKIERQGERILICGPVNYNLLTFSWIHNPELQRGYDSGEIRGFCFKYKDLESVKNGDVIVKTGVVEKPFTYDDRGNLRGGTYRYARCFGKKGHLTPKHEIVFPYSRPYGSEWTYDFRNIAFTKDIKKENWPLFLRAIEGKFFKDVNSNERVKALVVKRRLLERSGERIQKAGACFDACSFDLNTDIEVGIGERLLFKGYKNGKLFFAVDSPNYGTGLYFFDEEEPANDWANGRIDFRTARSKATRFIVHSTNWEERARLAV